MAKLSIPEGHQPAIELISSLDERGFEQLLAGFREVPPSKSLKRSVAAVAATSNQPEEDIFNLLQSVSGMATAREQLEWSLSQLVDEVAASALEQGMGSLGEDENALTRFKDRLTILLGDECGITLSAKAALLSRIDSRTVSATRIVSDIRPVFDSHDTAGGALIVHRLILTLVADDDPVIVDLSPGQIRALRNTLERAETKHGVLQELLNQAGLDYLTPFDTAEDSESDELSEKEHNHLLGSKKP